MSRNRPAPPLTHLQYQGQSTVTVEGLADELWPHGPPPTWRAAVRNLVARTRGCFQAIGLPPDVVAHRSGRYVVDVPDLSVDVEVALHAAMTAHDEAAEGRVEDARDRARDALVVLDLPVVPEIESRWLASLRGHLHRRRVDTLVLLARCERITGHVDAARQAASRAIAVAPLHEQGWRELMRIDADAGNTAAALEAFHRCRRRLADDLGAEPDARTQRLHVRILRGDQTGASATWSMGSNAHPTSPTLSRAEAEPPLVGRETAVAEVVGHLRDGVHVLVRGPAGIGKTRLVAESLGRSGAAERPADRVMGSTATARLNLATLAPIVGRTSGAVPLPELFGHFLQRWRDRATPQGPALVWLDDAQHVDPLSAAILRHATTIGTIQLLATHQTPRVLGDDLAALLVEGLVRPLDLPPLDVPAAIELAHGLSPVPLAPSELDRLLTLAAGNPLFIRELAASIDPHDPVLRLDRIDDLVARPLRALGSRPRRTAELIAVAEPVPASLFATRSEDVALLLRQGLVRRQGGRSLRLDHPLRTAWLVEQLGPEPCAAHRELVALADASGASGDLDAVTLVDWTLRAGQRPEPTLAETAAATAVARSDGPMVLRLAAAMEGPARDLRRAQGHVLSGDLDTGLELLEEVRRDAAVDQRVEAASWLARYVGVMQGDFDRGHAVLSDEHVAVTEPRHRRLLLLGRLWLWIFGPITEELHLHDLVDLASTEPVDSTSHDLLVAGWAVLQHRASETDVHHLRRRIRQLETDLAISPNSLTQARAVECADWMFAARLDRASELAKTHFPEVIRAGPTESVTLFGGMGAFAMAHHGDIQDAVATGNEAVRRTVPTDWFRYGLLARLILAGNRCYAGEVDLADLDLSRIDVGDETTFDLLPIWHARAIHLGREARGRRASFGVIRAAVQLLVAHGKYGWPMVLGAELLDRRAPRDVLRLVLDAAERLEHRRLGTIVVTATRARLDQDADRLLGAGLDFELAGFPAAATRAFADVVADHGPDGTTGQAARQAIVRSWRSWDGVAMWWTADTPGLPGFAAARRYLATLDASPASDPPRSDRDLQDLGDPLDIAGPTALARTLAPRRPPPDWRPGGDPG